MKLTRDKLKLIVQEELEQEGFFGKMKAKIAPGMAAKSVADEHAIFTVKNGKIDIDPSAVKGSNPESVVKLVWKHLGDLVQDENFHALPTSAKARALNAFELVKQAKMSSSGDASRVVSTIVRDAPGGTGLDDLFTRVQKGVESGQSSASSSEYDREARARRDRNEYEREKNARLDAELARQKDKESFERELRMAQYEPPESRARRPEDRGGRSDLYSGNEYTNKSVRDAWEESKKLKQNDLVKIIKEEFQEMMKESESARRQSIMRAWRDAEGEGEEYEDDEAWERAQKWDKEKREKEADRQAKLKKDKK
jgi:hypothetical protein